MALDVTGSPDELAQAALSWFERLLRRPIERWEWVYDGGVYAHQYLFTDTGEGLVSMHNHLFGPPGGGPLGEPGRTVRIQG